MSWVLCLWRHAQQHCSQPVTPLPDSSVTELLRSAQVEHPNSHLLPSIISITQPSLVSMYPSSCTAAAPAVVSAPSVGCCVHRGCCYHPCTPTHLSEGPAVVKVVQDALAGEVPQVGQGQGAQHASLGIKARALLGLLASPPPLTPGGSHNRHIGVWVFRWAGGVQCMWDAVGASLCVTQLMHDRWACLCAEMQVHRVLRCGGHPYASDQGRSQHRNGIKL